MEEKIIQKLDEVLEKLHVLEQQATSLEVKSDRIWRGVKPVIDKVLEL